MSDKLIRDAQGRTGTSLQLFQPKCEFWAASNWTCLPFSFLFSSHRQIQFFVPKIGTQNETLDSDIEEQCRGSLVLYKKHH